MRLGMIVASLVYLLVFVLALGPPEEGQSVFSRLPYAWLVPISLAHIAATAVFWDHYRQSAEQQEHAKSAKVRLEEHDLQQDAVLHWIDHLQSIMEEKLSAAELRIARLEHQVNPSPENAAALENLEQNSKTIARVKAELTDLLRENGIEEPGWGRNQGYKEQKLKAWKDRQDDLKL